MAQVREHWSSRVGFILAAVGSAVGLGVLWKFPYTVGRNGGGFFILCYVLCTLAIGIPVLIAELMLGRIAQRGAIGVFEQITPTRPFWKLSGWLGVISSFLIMSFYSVIAGWGMCYILMSLSGFFHGLTIHEVSDRFTTLANSGDISLLWHFLFTGITMMIVFSGVRKGIEAWSRIMTRGLFILLTLLFFHSISLPGFGQALHFVFYPDASKFQISSMLEALGLAFFTLSLGQGIMFSYGSYMKPKTSIPQMAFIVSFAVLFVGILAALVVFPVVFSFGIEPTAGFGLIFQTLPYLFSKLPGGMIISTLFFTLFVFTAITSSVAFIEVCASNLMELVGWQRHRSVWIVAIATFIFGIPSALSGSRALFVDWNEIYGMSFLETVDTLVSTWLIPIGGLLTAIYVGWVMQKDIAQGDFVGQRGSTLLYSVWIFIMRWLVPLLILFIIVEKSGLFS